MAAGNDLSLESGTGNALPAVSPDVIEQELGELIDNIEWPACAAPRVQVEAIEERYRALFSQMDQGLGIAEIEFAGDVAVDLRWLDVNPQFERVTGLSREEVLGARSMRELAPGLEPEWLEIFGQVARTGQTIRIERRSDFLDRWLDVNAFRIGDATTRQIVVLITDTTERAQATANLAFLAAVADDYSRVSSMDAIVHVMSERCAQHFGASRCELVDDTPDARKRDTSREVMVGIGRVGERQLGLVVANAQPRVWKPQEVELIGALARQLHPVLQRAAAEDALRGSRERLRLIVENARDYAILTADLDRRITSWNPGAERLTGYAADEAIGQTADIIFTPEGRAAGAPQREAQTAIAEGRASDERWHVRARRLAILGQRLDARDARRVGRSRGLAEDLPRPDGGAARQGSAGEKPPGAVGSAAGNRARTQGCRGRRDGPRISSSRCFRTSSARRSRR